MRLVGISMVKNEADIIELFVRHNLALLDHLIVLDHFSTDLTADLLKRLQGEGLPVSVLGGRDLAYRQAQQMTELMRLAATDFGADLVVPLDADEFLLPSPDWRTRLTELGAAEVGTMNWRNYVPAGEAQDCARLRTWATQVLELPEPPGRKVLVPKLLARHPRFSLATGQHALLDRDHPGAVVSERPLDYLSLAHFPLRSLEQSAAKVLVGYFGHRLAFGQQAKATRICWHWQAFAGRLLRGEVLTWQDLPALIAQAYQGWPEHRRIEAEHLRLLPLDSQATRRWPVPAPQALTQVALFADQLLDQLIHPSPAAGNHR